MSRSQAPAAAPSSSERWLTLGQACRVLGVDESTLRRWADNGHVHAFRTPGGHRRFSESELSELLSGQTPNGQHYRELGELAINRIRRRLHRRPTSEAPWFADVDEGSRERLRPLGRRLAALTSEYLGRKTRRSGLLDDAREMGHEYGRELAGSGITLPHAVEAFVFFRRSLDDATKQASQRHGLAAGDALNACEQVIDLADQVLVGLVEAYEGAGATAGATS
ncbi:MAG: helix-turn-helix domain-containing protein [Dehalococcoidia bacterium]